MEIGNRTAKTAFCGVIKNSTWTRVKKYALENGKKEELKAFEDFCNKQKIATLLFPADTLNALAREII